MLLSSANAAVKKRFFLEFIDSFIIDSGGSDLGLVTRFTDSIFLVLVLFYSSIFYTQI